MPETQLPPIVLQTPDSHTIITTTVRRSWAPRLFAIASGVVSFTLAVLGYLQTVQLTNFGLSTDKALFYGSIIGLVQFILMWYSKVHLVKTTAEPGNTATPPEGQG